MKPFYYLLILFSSLVFISGCRSSHSKSDGLITIRDMLGRDVKVPENVQKVVGVKAGALRLLSYLGAADMVAGVEEVEKKSKNPYNFANPEYNKLPVIGPMHGGDAELITLVKPDIIFMTYATVGEAEKLQSKTGIPVVTLHYGDLCQNREMFFTAIKLMAGLIHKSQRADSLINFVNRAIEDLNRRTEKVSLNNNPIVYAGGISFKGSHGISSTVPEFAPFEYVHANNPASQFQSSNNSVFIDKEQLIEWNPEKVFIDYAGWDVVKDDLEQDALAYSLDAIRNNELYMLLPYNWYTTNFATILVNSYYIGSILYPGAFSDLNIEEQADTIYTAFLNKPVYKEMTNHFGELKQVFINKE